MELTEDGRLSTLKLEDKQSGFFLRLRQAQEAAPGSSSTKAALSPIRTRQIATTNVDICFIGINQLLGPLDVYLAKGFTP